MNNNGFISFLEELTSYRPTNFSDPNYDEKIPLIAPYWADVDIEHVRDTDFNETVVFRQSNESHILDRATADVRDYFTDQREFSARMVFISTWYKVGYYGATGEGKRKVRNVFYGSDNPRLNRYASQPHTLHIKAYNGTKLQPILRNDHV